MKQILINIILLLSVLCSAKTIRVAVIDTGINRKLNLPLCPGPHKTFVSDDINDEYGHGSLVSEIINKEAKNADYCIIVIKVFDGKLNEKFIEGIVYASTLNVDIVNISGGGGPSPDLRERQAIELMIKKKVVIVAAAGNNGNNLDSNCNYFPACYGKDIIVVGQKNNPKSNHGKIVDIYAPGKVTLTNGKVMEGTSFSTAFVTGNLIRVMSKKNAKHN